MSEEFNPTFALNDEKTLYLRRSKIENWVVVAILVGVAIFTAADLVGDMGDGASALHLVGEGTVTVLCIIGAFLLWRRTLNLQVQVLNQKEITAKVALEKQAAQIQAEKWRTEASQALQGLSDAIDAQLTRWELTKSEKEVALLLLKGLSLKEIANLREVSEKTARAQSFAVYAKSGLSGRAELSAFFLEDLMLPQVP